MKPNVKLLIAVALLATACTTGSKVTNGGYSDDLYFTPGDAQPSAPKAVKQVKKQPEKKSTVAMEVEENEQGKVVNNYLVPKSSRKDKNAYYFNDQPAYADTVMEYKDDKEQVTVNNYFEGEEMNYSTRIRTFYNPYFYDPFWDPYWGGFYDPYFGSPFSWGLGWGGMYGGYYGGYYGGFYNPWNPWFGYGYGGFGYGGYGYGGFGYGGYGFGSGWGWTSGGYYASGGWSNGNYYIGKQNSTGRHGESNAVRYGTNNTRSGLMQGSGSYNGQVLGRNPNASSNRLPSANGTNGAVQLTRSAVSGGVGATGTRQLSTREATVLQQGQGTNTMQGTRVNRGETISNLRRSGTNNIQSNGAVNQNNMSSRPVSSGRDYTPTYNRPRMNTQASYNNGSIRQYNSPQSNGNTQGTRYARPQSSGGSFGGAVRTQTQQSGSYQRGAASSSPTRSTPTPSSSRSYSPGYSGSSNFSSPSYGGRSSGGGSVGGSSGGSSGGGNTGGGGGSGRSR